MFNELTIEELMVIDGGDVGDTLRKTGYAFLGTLAIAFTPIIAVVNPPAAIVSFGTGLYFIGSATK